MLLWLRLRVGQRRWAVSPAGGSFESTKVRRGQGTHPSPDTFQTGLGAMISTAEQDALPGIRHLFAQNITAGCPQGAAWQRSSSTAHFRFSVATCLTHHG